ncbi:MAG: hypothetical protein KF841_04230 [Phycisphaerae bacterium]|nr:hypothetical protein [Phycisphaerae bacterium]
MPNRQPARPPGPSTCDDLTASGETEYLLARWRISFWPQGCCRIQPAGPTVSPEELAGLIALLGRCCDAESPKLIVFRFGRARIIGEQWTLVIALLEHFAAQLGAFCRVVSNRNGRAKSVLIHRKPGDRLE